MSFFDNKVKSPWSRHFLDLSKKSNAPMFLIILIVASLLLITDFFFSNEPRTVTYIRIAVTLLGFLSYLLFKLKLIKNNLMVLIYVIPTSLTGCYMISIQSEVEGIVKTTSLALIFGFVMISMLTMSPKVWIILSSSVIIPYLYLIFFRGQYPVKVYLSNAGALLIICYCILPYVAAIQYKLYKKNFMLQNKIEYFANNDILTGCFNRRGGLNILQQALHMSERNKTPISISFIDVDGLKSINDNHGHTEGDKLLQTITTIIKENIRKSDTLFRYGGDEFIVIFPGCKKAECTKIMNTIYSAMEEHKESSLSFSYGIAEYTSELSLEGLISIADKKMYINKSRQRIK